MVKKHICITLGLLFASLLSLRSQDLDHLGILNNDAIETYKRISKLNAKGNTTLSSQNYRLDSIYYWIEEENGQNYILGAKSELVYEINRVTYLNYEIDSVLELVVDDFRVYEYNDDGQLIRFTNNPWNGVRTDIAITNPSFVFKREYNENGLVVKEINQNNIDFLLDRPTILRNYYYDSDSNLELIELSVRNNQDDFLTQLGFAKFSYNNQGKASSIVESNNHMTRGWELRDSIAYKYFADGDIQFVEEYWRSVTDSEWVPESLFGYNYNLDKSINFISEKQFYDLEKFEWLVEIKHRYEYASTGDLLEIISRVDGESLARRIENYDYNFNLNIVDILKPWELFEDELKPHYHAVTRENEWNNPWPGEPSSRYREYFYSERSLSKVDELLTSSSYNVIPNPATETIEIKSLEPFNQLDLKIYSISGQEVLAQRVDSGRLIDISVFAPGVYICKVSLEDITEVIRFVKL